MKNKISEITKYIQIAKGKQKNGNLNQANAVFYSPVDEQLHVADGTAMRIQSFDREKLNPLNDVEVRDGLHIFAITMAEKNIYFSDWESNSIKLILGISFIVYLIGINQGHWEPIDWWKLIGG